MFKLLKKIDKTLVQTFDYLGIPRIDQLDRGLLKLVNYRVKDTAGIEITVVLGFALAIVTLGSVARLYTLNVPEAIKDGLRLTTLLCTAGLAGLALHILVKRLAGGK